MNLNYSKKNNFVFNISLRFQSPVNFINFENKYGSWILEKKVKIKNKIEKNYYISVENFEVNSIKKIYNLFSSFGNIKEVIQHKIKKNIVILNYFSYKGTILTMRFLNNLKFNSKNIKIRFYKNFIFRIDLYEKIRIKNKLLRFKNNNNYEINTPNNLIYIQNIANKYNYHNFYNLIKKICDNIKFKSIRQNNKKKNFIIKFPNIEYSIKALMYFHNKNIINHDYEFKIKASFTHIRFN